MCGECATIAAPGRVTKCWPGPPAGQPVRCRPIRGRPEKQWPIRKQEEIPPISGRSFVYFTSYLCASYQMRWYSNWELFFSWLPGARRKNTARLNLRPVSHHFTLFPLKLICQTLSKSYRFVCVYSFSLCYLFLFLFLSDYLSPTCLLSNIWINTLT